MGVPGRVGLRTERLCSVEDSWELQKRGRYLCLHLDLSGFVSSSITVHIHLLPCSISLDAKRDYLRV